ncbi:MAG TPA: glycosyltransferase [Segeticoccus sp.]|uniref:glycosyltransferase n=1 Tax=Segeticoccus sp. TaxID=2706531 RepID=UPI002D80704E|nr:glycosyltransferase [Segeticoccus sp.]HET8601002.1 glycosyltransferase [Segeticoccus sp.]
MLQSVDVGERQLSAYHGLVPDALLDDLREAAAQLRGVRVLHLNATPYGGGVSELLRSVVPLLSDLGVVADWRVITGDSAFFDVTKAIHNGLQGAPAALTERQRATYIDNSRRNAELFEESYDLVVVHDPQPAGVLRWHGKGSARWVWRCHIDSGQPATEVWAFVRPFLEGYDAAVFTMDSFVPPELPIPHTVVIPPAIDPLSPKNLPLPRGLARQVLDWIGLRLDAPLVTQVARFDPWKDPLGVIHAYRLVRRDVPGLQLALAGSMALDDPEGWRVYEQIRAETGADPLVHVFTNLTGVGNVEVNALQRLSDVVVQKSTREGFGLVVSEALWKGTPVVAGRAGGIPLQMADGVGGFLVGDVAGCATAIRRLLNHPDEGSRLAERGRERVREHFLLPRLVLNELQLMDELLAGHPRSADGRNKRDPVCGLSVRSTDPPHACTRGRRYMFCSEACRARFEEDPRRWVPSPVARRALG